MIVEQIPAVQQLTLHEKWLLANELWNEVEEHQEALPTHPEIVALVEQRLADHEKDTGAALPLEVFKRRSRLP